MAQETLPAPTDIAVVGEVIVPLTEEEQAALDASREELAALESVAEVGIAGLASALQSAAASSISAGLALRRIQKQGLWKFAVNPDGGGYTNFNDYVTERFGWEKTYGRLSQVMRQAVDTARANGEIGDEEYEVISFPAKSGTSGTKAITPEAALRVTHKAIVNAQADLATRMESEPVKADKTLMKALRKVNARLEESIKELAALANERADEPVEDTDATEADAS